MSKIRVLSDHLINQIAAGEVVERPASVAKELVENAIDAGARRVEVDVEAGGRRLLRVADDGGGMTRDDALLAFERHATSKISRAEDLMSIRTLGFRGEALASIASVARVELITQLADETEGTRVLIEGGRMRDVQPAARPRGTTVTVRDLFFNVPARRKFLRSEATESFHLMNLVTHYALAHPEIEFVLTNNGRETLRAAPAVDLRERAYQIFGAEFLDSLLTVDGGLMNVARARGFISAPRERRTTRDAQYLFVNGRFVRDRLISRALAEGYRTVLPHGVYPAALLFLDVPLEEVDVNVHPAKTEVRFRRAAAVADIVRESVRAALAGGGYVRREPDDVVLEAEHAYEGADFMRAARVETTDTMNARALSNEPVSAESSETSARGSNNHSPDRTPVPQQEAIEFGFNAPSDEFNFAREQAATQFAAPSDAALSAVARHAEAAPHAQSTNDQSIAADANVRGASSLPPLNSIAGALRAVPIAEASHNIRPLYQLEESYIVATDEEGLLLIDQHAAHERILFDKYRALEVERRADAQQLLVPETFDLTPAQAAAFDAVVADLEAYGFSLMRLSGRTVAIKAVPADLPASEARNLFVEVLDAVDNERRGRTRATLRERVAAALACRAAIKVNTPLAPEKMRWLIDRLLVTSSPTTCPHGRPAILRLTTRDIERGFHRP